MSKKPSASFVNRAVSSVGIIVLLLVLGTLFLVTYLYVQKSSSPTPTQLLPDDGVKGTYMVSQGKHTGPTVSQIVFDPLDVKKRQQLTIIAHITNPTPIQKVTGVLQMDHGSQDVVFERISGTDLNGVWQTTLTLKDSVFYTYIITITATAINGTNTVVTAPRSP